VLLAFGIPTLVAALAMQSAPLHVSTEKVTAPVQELNMGSEIGTTVTGRYQLHVRFTNDGNQPIKRIVFAFDDGSRVVDAGTFAPGVTIDHTLDRTPSDADSCNVESATFADGTQWRAGRPQAQAVDSADVPSGTFQTSGPSAEGGG
jgi:hypothetical protein